MRNSKKNCEISSIMWFCGRETSMSIASSWCFLVSLTRQCSLMFVLAFISISFLYNFVNFVGVCLATFSRHILSTSFFVVVVVAFTFPSSLCSSFALSSRVHNTRRSFYSTSKTFLKSYYLFKLLTFFLFVDNAINLFELYFLCMCARYIFCDFFFRFSFVLECILLRVQRIRYEHLQTLYWCSGRSITLILLSHRSALICSFRFWYLFFLINKQNFIKILHEKMPNHCNYCISLSSTTDNSENLSLCTIASLNWKIWLNPIDSMQCWSTKICFELLRCTRTYDDCIWCCSIQTGANNAINNTSMFCSHDDQIRL